MLRQNGLELRQDVIVRPNVKKCKAADFPVPLGVRTASITPGHEIIAAAKMDLSNVLSIAAPIVLALMGAIIVIWPPHNRWRIACCALFLSAGALAVWAGIRDRQEQTIEAQGGDQFCFVSILSRQDAKGDFPLVVTNPGDLPLYDVTLVVAKSGNPFNEITIPISVLPPKETFPHRRNLDVPLDQYIILIYTRATPVEFLCR